MLMLLESLCMHWIVVKWLFYLEFGSYFYFSFSFLLYVYLIFDRIMHIEHTFFGGIFFCFFVSRLSKNYRRCLLMFLAFYFFFCFMFEFSLDAASKCVQLYINTLRRYYRTSTSIKIRTKRKLQLIFCCVCIFV